MEGAGRAEEAADAARHWRQIGLATTLQRLDVDGGSTWARALLN